jgi:transcriptional regulator with XRE-family HTH domain
MGTKVEIIFSKIFRFTVNLFTFADKIFRFMEDNKNTVERIIRKIREVRKQKGYSNDAMAVDLDMSTSAYNKLERMETVLTLERFLRIRDILQIPYSDFFECNGNSYQQDLKDSSIGHYEVQNLYQENREVYEKLVQSKDEQIAFLKDLLEKK